MENKDGYELDPLLETVLEEQMIEGGVPESEVDPSIKDIEEAMDKRLKEKKGNQEYDIEAYANVPEEFNQRLISLMGHMRAAGVPQQTIMREIRELIELYISSNPNNMESNNQVNNMDNNFEVNRAGIPNDHLGWYAPEKTSGMDDWHTLDQHGVTPDIQGQISGSDEVAQLIGGAPATGSDDSQLIDQLAQRFNVDPKVVNAIVNIAYKHHWSKTADYSEEELYNIDNPAEPSAAERVAEYLDKHDEEGSELWTHLWEGSRALSNGNIEDGSAHLRILIEIFQNLLTQLEQGRTAKTAASEPMGLDTRGWTITDYQWGQTNRPDYLEYVLLEHPTQGWIQADGIDIDYEGGTVNFSTETHGLPSGPYEKLVDVDRGDTQASFKTVGYFSPQNDTDVPDATYGAQDAPSDIIDIVNSYVSEDESINEAIDTHLAENPPEPDWDSMPGGADW
jgi:hypothetical protein